MAVEICVLASGSKGNCTYVSDGTTRILIDAGISCKQIEERLSNIGVSLSDINAVLVTHEHSDHIMGLRTLDKKYATPILANQKTATCVDVRLHINTIRWLKEGFDTGFKIGGIQITPFRISHDAVCPVGYTLTMDGKKVSFVTDLGYVTQGVYNTIKGSDIVVLESNHDLKMLSSGRYPLELQARIRGNSGHLSNNQSAELALALVKSGTRNIFLAHLSEENNTPELAYTVMKTALEGNGLIVGKDIFLCLTSQNHATDLFRL